MIFKSPNKQLVFKNNIGQVLPFDLKIQLNGKKLLPSSHVKYLGVLIDDQLKWNFYINELSTKLSRATGMIAKIRHYVNAKSLSMIYHGIFSSLLLYGSQIWGQSNQAQMNMAKIQDKAIRIMSFKHKRYPVDNLYKNLNLLKFEDCIKLSNFLLAYDNFKNKLPKSYVDH